jgi:hypothetical protein
MSVITGMIIAFIASAISLSIPNNESSGKPVVFYNNGFKKCFQDIFYMTYETQPQEFEYIKRKRNCTKLIAGSGPCNITGSRLKGIDER